MGNVVIKPIETHYKGYRFRSRLEARWAVFLDALGIRYEYEIEGYDLGEAGWYLPDFWLPQQEIIVEIKPPLLYDKKHPAYILWPDMTKQEALVIALSESGLHHHVMMLCGAPGPKEKNRPPLSSRPPFSYEGLLIRRLGPNFDGPACGFRPYHWYECLCCGEMGITVRWGRAGCLGCGNSGVLGLDTPRLRAAYIAARSARF